MGKKSFFPPNNWCCPVLPLLHSMHEATIYWQRQCAARDRFSQEGLSSAQPPLIEPSSWKTTTKAAPPSLCERGWADEMTTKATPPSLGEQGGSNAMTTKAVSPSLGKQGGSNVTTTKAAPPIPQQKRVGGRDDNEGHSPAP